MRIAEGETLPIGVGFLAWQLDATGPDMIDIALKFGIKAVWLSFGLDLAKWIQYVRAHEASRGVLIFVVVSTLEEARTAALDWEVDVIVAQGEIRSVFRLCHSNFVLRERVRRSWIIFRASYYHPFARDYSSTT